MTRYVEHYGAILSVMCYLFVALRLVGRHEERPRWQWAALLGLGIFYAAAALDPLVNAAYLPPGAPKFYLTTVAVPVFAYALALGGWLSRRASRFPAQAPAMAATGSGCFCKRSRTSPGQPSGPRRRPWLPGAGSASPRAVTVVPRP
ncbi:hypothetical protein I2I05_08780 [Hymenobacter sp. BT683]|uniref:Histidine kinase N-terminal 7TM region domain-containing protein n=1 Tax=Hymenobacter jeongseonensis TaxID=2791027 RepID=A0ABS0IH41_9BACT|nr:hypothetical protein [Hymenobacter jeongseonensis]MBF9237492.1 hypothetical protein [Hymenobacter jeongseonensis]